MPPPCCCTAACRYCSSPHRGTPRAKHMGSKPPAVNVDEYIFASRSGMTAGHVVADTQKAKPLPAYLKASLRYHHTSIRVQSCNGCNPPSICPQYGGILWQTANLQAQASCTCTHTVSTSWCTRGTVLTLHPQWTQDEQVMASMQAHLAPVADTPLYDACAPIGCESNGNVAVAQHTNWCAIATA